MLIYIARLCTYRKNLMYVNIIIIIKLYKNYNKNNIINYNILIIKFFINISKTITRFEVKILFRPSFFFSSQIFNLFRMNIVFYSNLTFIQLEIFS